MTGDLNELLERRHRLGAGFSEHSWIKHDLVQKLVAAQVHAYRARFPDQRILLIDGNAGDGSGVAKAQQDMFQTSMSRPTAQLLTELAKSIGNCDVVLCDKDKGKRFKLMHRFPFAMVVERHQDILDCVRPQHCYGLWLSDPCGYAQHGIPWMRAITRLLLCDFVVVFNEGSLNRMLSTKAENWRTHRQLYSGMAEPSWWLTQLNKRYLARTQLIPASAGFRYRLLVLANFLADGVRRMPVEVIEKGEQ